MNRVFYCFVVFLAALGDCGFSQSLPSDEPQFQGRSRTINQRITPVWIDDSHLTFTQQFADGSVATRWVDAETGEIKSLENDNDSSGKNVLRGGPLPNSQSSALETSLEFVNESDVDVQIFWIDPRGRRVQYGSLAPGESRSQHTFAEHAWMVQSTDGRFFGSVIAQSPPIVARIKQTFDPPEPTQPARSRGRWMDRVLGRIQSPSGSSSLQPGPSGLRLRLEGEDDPTWIELDFGPIMDDQQIVSPSWSPDGTVVAAWKVHRHEATEAVTIESSPDGGGRANVKRHPYRLPGDAYDEFELFVFDASSGTRLRTDLPVIDFGRPSIHWFSGHKMAIQKVDRGHQRVRLFVLDPVAETVATVVDESSPTFIWTTHGPQIPLFQFLEKSDEVIYASEYSGYRHLYRVDLNSDGSHGEEASVPVGLERPITCGDWLVREIVRIDEETRTLDLLVGEYYDDQDPYHQHLVRVGIDTGETVAVTQADGDHSIQFSPDGRFVIATHSRVDSPPIHELRRASDGSLVTELMRAERLIRDESPWGMPRVFHSVGRDGETQIWGNLYFPDDFDPALNRHYPVIEAIYAGPHDSHVPKRYSHSKRFDELTSLGFVVVQIDGMGTANRSKAFHDQCWHNLKDAGFPDRIAWIKAAADEYPAIDPTRVGVFGTSAGGQNACGALLFHGDFYKAAYASCGCHDNRMDKASWNEQWMGYPVGEHYAANSNIDNAHRLQGDLFLVVGELDTNVPPESTYRLVDALVKANKDFEFLMIPGMGHSDGGEYGRRKMREFFVEKLRP